MRFSLTYPIVSGILLALTGLASSSPVQPRVSIRTAENGISAPTGDDPISSNSPFSFSYIPFDYCHESYSGVTVWLLPGPEPPAASSMNATQSFSEGEFLTYYGEWVIADFTFLPPLAPGPPPETFTAPELDPSLIGSTVYVTVIETVTGCPPQGETEYVLSSVGVTYAG